VVFNRSAAAAPLGLLRQQPALRSFVVARAIDELGAQMLNVAIGWQVYAATRDPMSLAWVGLVRFLPTVATALIAGQAADRFDRRGIIGLSLLLQTGATAVFAVLSLADVSSALPIYALLLVLGVAQAFSFPAASALLPRLVSEREFPRAVALASSALQICGLLGPALGGAIYALSAPAMFAVTAVLYAIAFVQVRRLPGAGRQAGAAGAAADAAVLGGIRYIRRNRLLLAITSLDLFAVLLGGVTALLPIYARDILAVGPAGLGALRCAPGIGAAIVGFLVVHRATERGAGKRLLVSVAGFGLATIVFALSRSFWLSLAALAALGGFDMVSMVIRQTLVQSATPDAMRGRVSAVNGVFIGASSELGEFESGLTAALFGTVPAALLGGLGTLAVVALWARIFPELRGADRLPASLP
jgi:MFS family permease